MQTGTPVRNPSYVTPTEIAAALRRPSSTVHGWAAGSGRSFPPAVRLPNRNVIVHIDDLLDWPEMQISCASGPVHQSATRWLPADELRAPVKVMNTEHDPLHGDSDRFFTVEEFAAYIRQSPHTVCKWSRRGGKDFPKAIRLPNRAVLIEREAADRWLKERRS